jgi:hypothetical protein
MTTKEQAAPRFPGPCSRHGEFLDSIKWGLFHDGSCAPTARDLERDFSVIDIERAVGAALKPKDNVDLSAHRTLLALSRDAAGKVQLVTTNFDLLFEVAAPEGAGVDAQTPSRSQGYRGF